jgi:hypothetical protein
MGMSILRLSGKDFVANNDDAGGFGHGKKVASVNNRGEKTQTSTRVPRKNYLSNSLQL